jgi:BRCA1 C Terminus (BRCT) domain
MHRGNARVTGTPKRKAFIAPKLVLNAPGNKPAAYARLRFASDGTLKATYTGGNPPPAIAFLGSCFCFTGTFAFGTRKECEAAVLAKGGVCKSLTHETGYLVIGAYATDSWAHSSFGRKIEKAVHMREKGSRIAIVAEPYWVGQLRQSSLAVDGGHL